MSEVGLYGGGFTIPSQIGNTGRLLTTDGTSFGWSTTAALPSVTVPEPTSTNKGRALVSTGTGIEFSDFNSGVSTGFKVYKSGTAFEEVTTNTAVLFDQTTTNVGAGSYSTTAGTYTVPVTGYYNIFANFEKLDVGFSCTKNGQQALSGSNTYFTITNWTIGTPNHNINTNFNTSTGVFTVPCDGYYQTNANIRVDGIGSGYARLIFSIDNNTNYDYGSGHSIAHSNETANYHTMNLSQIIKLNKNQTLTVKIFSDNDSSFIAYNESTWSCHLIEQKSEFVLQKSTNSGTSYTDIKKAKNNLSETVYLNQNDLIRIISDSTNKLTFNQGDLNNSFGAQIVNQTFTTANPLLANPSTADKGKIVTVNADGTDLQYGATFRELACKQTLITNSIYIDDDTYNNDYWLDLASHNTIDNINTLMNTEAKVNVSQNSKVEIKVQITFGVNNIDNFKFGIRLGKKVNNTIIWGNSSGFVDITNSSDLSTDEAQSDPKGDKIGSDLAVRVWAATELITPGNEQYYTSSISASYIDQDPTNGQSGYHDVTYFIRLLHVYQDNNSNFYIGRSHYINDLDRSTFPTILSATEIGSGAITSFTQEKALAGAGGTAAFTANVSTGGVLTNYGPLGNLFNNILYASDITGNNSELVHLKKSNNSWFVGIEFTTPQIVTKYRIWGRHEGNSNQIPKSWELRAANDSSTYNSGTHTVIDSQSNATFASYSTSGQVPASDHLSFANEYNLSTIGAYKYYVIHITENYGNADYVTIAEVALYGGGFTIPSQIGHSGKTLKTNGTALEWSAPLTGLLPPPVPENKGKIITVNSTGDDLEYGANFRELACNERIEDRAIIIKDKSEHWIDLALHNNNIYDGANQLSSKFYTDCPITVSHGSKVKISASVTIGTENNDQHFAFRLGKKVDGVIVWGNSSGETSTRNDAQTDPKGDVSSVPQGYPDNTSRTESWFQGFSENTFYYVRNSDGEYIDTNPTNGLTGSHTITYFLRVFLEYPHNEGVGGAGPNDFTFNVAYDDDGSNDRVAGITRLSAVEIGSGAITSFTQEQALAGAGGTAAFTIGGSSIYTGGSPPIFGTLSNLVDNVLDDVNGQLVVLNVSGGPWIVTFNFTTPQIVTKYRIWGRYDAGGGNYTQSPKNWELRAATDSSTYNASLSSTYTVLDSQSNAIFSSYVADNITASDNLSKSNEYNLSTIGAYKYYVLHITGNGTHANYCTMSEIALYGGGFTIPSQVGHSGKILKTNGTSLKWEAPVDALLPAPTAADNGKIITVNSAGDDLEYGGNFRELACKQTIITNALIISQANVLDKWADLASHNTNNNIHLQMNTETKINVSQNSKVEIKAQISVSHANNSNLHVAIRLGKKVGNTIIWGNSTGTISEGDTIDEAQTDPKGDVDGDKHPVWKSVNSQGGGDQEQYLLFNLNACYIDEDPTNGLSGYHDVTYFIRILKLYDPADLYIGMPNNNIHHRTTVPTILSATEIGFGAITSFTQEQALAGAGGTAGGTPSVTDSISPSARGADKIFDGKIGGGNNDQWVTTNTVDLTTVEIAYEFNTPQIVTKYRLWPRNSSYATSQSPSAWEVRAAIDSSTYISGTPSTYTLLDVKSGLTSSDWNNTISNSGLINAVDNLEKANEYNLSTIDAYKYYVIKFTAGTVTNPSINTNHLSLSEVAFYGGGFTIPSQIGHSGKILKTNGTSLKWEAPVDALLPAATTADKGKIVTVNSTGTDLEYGPQYVKHNMNFKNIYETGSFTISASTANNNPRVHDKMNITITPQLTTSKVMITVNMMGEPNISPENIMAYLKRTVNGVVTNLLPPVDSTNTNANRGLGQFVTSLSASNDTTMDVCNFHYIDEPNTTSEVEYDVMLVSNNETTLYYNRVKSTAQTNTWYERGASFMSAEEKFANDDNVVGAITSFTQEQALAGAGGTAAFTAYGIKNTSYLTSSDYHTGHVISNLYDNYLRRAGTLVAISNSDTVSFAYDFSTPQIVTKYRMWPRATSEDNDVQAPSSWELRAATTKTLYDAGTYTILDSHTGLGELDWDQTIVYNRTATELNSDNLSKANEYNLATIGAYKYYVLHITSVVNISAGTLGNLLSLGEFALYGGGFTIPSQIGNAGKQLITNGTSLTWGSPSSILVPSPTGNANKVLQANSAGTGLEYGDTGTIKEYISGYCDGHTVSLKSGGTLTFQNVTAVQHLNTTNTDLTGSTVSYLPPSGTTLVVYELIYNVSHPNDSNAMIVSSRFYIDGVEQTGVKLGNQGYRFSDRVIMKVPIRITGTSDDPANVTVSSWNTSKTLKIKIKEWASNWPGTAHAPRWFDGQSSDNSQLNRPSLTIIAK
jgi:hypothetical protein